MLPRRRQTPVGGTERTGAHLCVCVVSVNIRREGCE